MENLAHAIHAMKIRVNFTLFLKMKHTEKIEKNVVWIDGIQNLFRMYKIFWIQIYGALGAFFLEWHGVLPCGYPSLLC